MPLSKPPLFLIPLLLLSFFALFPLSARAQCDSYQSQLDSLSARIDAGADESNAMLASMEQFLAAARELIEPFRQADAKGKVEFLLQMDQLTVQAQQLCEQRKGTMQHLVDLWEEIYSVVQSASAEGCVAPELPGQVRDVINKERQAQNDNVTGCQEIDGYRADVARDLATFRAEAAQAAKQSDEPATVRVVNAAGMDVCIHPGGMNGGLCIGPGKERVYKLKGLYGVDTDTNQKYPTSTLMVVGGGVWSGSPYTEYHGMTLCLKRKFNHESGEVVWRIVGGLEENCGLRGYHQ